MASLDNRTQCERQFKFFLEIFDDYVLVDKYMEHISMDKRSTLDVIEFIESDLSMNNAKHISRIRLVRCILYWQEDKLIFL